MAHHPGIARRARSPPLPASASRRDARGRQRLHRPRRSVPAHRHAARRRACRGAPGMADRPGVRGVERIHRRQRPVPFPPFGVCDALPRRGRPARYQRSRCRNPPRSRFRRRARPRTRPSPTPIRVISDLLAFVTGATHCNGAWPSVCVENKGDRRWRRQELVRRPDRCPKSGREGCAEVPSNGRDSWDHPRSSTSPRGDGKSRGRGSAGHVVYYLLAAFDVLTVSASLYLSARLLDIYRRSVAAEPGVGAAPRRVRLAAAARRRRQRAGERRLRIPRRRAGIGARRPGARRVRGPARPPPPPSHRGPPRARRARCSRASRPWSGRWRR